MKHGGNVWEGGQPDRWLDFSANLRPEGPPDWVMDTMRDALTDARFYPDRALTQAREGLAAYPRRACCPPPEARRRSIWRCR